MDFVKNITDKAKEVAVYAGDVAKTMAENAKANVQIATEHHNIDKAYRQIGEWYCNEHDGEYPEAIRDIAESIQVSLEHIRELQATPAEEDDVPPASVGGVVCPVCGTASDSHFCPNCGTKLD